MRRLSWLCLLIAVSYTLPCAQHAKAHTPGRTVNVNSTHPDHTHTPITFNLLAKKDRPWRICVFFPHLKDSYWAAVNYGITDEAKHVGVSMHLYQAGGYNNVAVQIRQIRKCVAENGQGIVLAATSLDGLNPIIAELHKQEIPVIDLINGISSPLVSAHSTVSFFEMGSLTGQYLVKRHTKEETKTKIAWFPGPKNAGWVQDGEQGFKAALQDSSVDIVSTHYGDTTKAAQTKNIEDALRQNPDLDYIVGTAVTAEVAVNILRKRKLRDKVKIVSYYFSPGIYRGILRGNILAAPADSPVVQARVAMTQIVQILEGNPVPKHISPPLLMIDRDSASNFDHGTSLAPSGFRPSFVINR